MSSPMSKSRECLVDPVQNVGNGLNDGQPSLGHGPEGYLILIFQQSLAPLLASLIEQTAAINRLASSNEALVQAMSESEGMDDVGPGGSQYLGGGTAG